MASGPGWPHGPTTRRPGRWPCGRGSSSRARPGRRAWPRARPVARVAAELGLSRDTVRKWRSRFLAMRLAGLRDAPRPGAPRTITDEQVAGVIARLLLEAPPAGLGRWSTRLMAAETGMSQSAVSRIWRQAGLSDPGRLDLTRIGDNDRMGNMQAGFQPR